MRWRPLAFVIAAVAFGPRVAWAEPTVPECLSASERGQIDRDEGRYLRAQASFATCASQACPAPVQRDCAKALGDLAPNIPSIVFVVRDASGADRADVVVRMDGAVLASRLDGKPLPVDPGEHVFELQLDGRRIERRAVIAVGERNRVFRVNDETASPAVPMGTIVFGSLGAVALGAAVALWVTAKNDLDAIESSPCAATKTCAQSDLDAVRTRLVVGDVAAGVGVLAAGTAIFFWLTRDRGGAVGVGPGGLRWSGSF